MRAAPSRFAHDGATQNYVELEGGGRAAFGALVKGDLYAPYWWDVRIFRPGEVNEVIDPIPARRRVERLRAPRA